MLHQTAHELAGQTVTLKSGPYAGEQYKVEDYWDRVSGESWMNAVGNLAAMTYAFEAGLAGTPMDDEVLYGKVGFFGHLVHVSWL